MCQWSDCWCKIESPVRWIPSTGQWYTVEELEPEGPWRVFRYRYLESYGRKTTKP
jgi:hypothetical protein